MNTLIIGVFVLYMWGVPIPIQSTTTPTIVPEPPPIAPVVVKVDTSTTEGIKQRIKYYADLYGVSEVTMDTIVKNESRYKPNANGDGGLSHGLVQIYAPAHPNITHKQAHDIDWSLDFLAKNLKAGKCHMWSTCPTS